MYREDKKADSPKKVEQIPNEKEEGFEREKDDAFEVLAKELEVITLDD